MKKKDKELRELTSKRERVLEVDLLRGFPIFLVVLYHLCYDFIELPSIFANYSTNIVNYPHLESLVGFCQSIMSNPIIHDYLVPLFAGMFLFACGVSSSLTRSNLKRGLILALVAVVLSLGSLGLSYLLNTDLFIIWGILHIMAFSILVYAVLELIITKVFRRRVHPLIPLAIGVVVLFAGLLLRQGVNIDGEIIKWPNSDFSLGYNLKDTLTFKNLVQSALGMSLNYVDWWPILPYSGVIFIGIAFGLALYGEKKKSYMKKGRYQVLLKPIGFIGSHTIWVYLLHQPIIIIVLGVVFLSLGFTL